MFKFTFSNAFNKYSSPVCLSNICNNKNKIRPHIIKTSKNNLPKFPCLLAPIPILAVLSRLMTGLLPKECRPI